MSEQGRWLRVRTAVLDPLYLAEEVPASESVGFRV